jgi:hypothetical protein
MISFCPDGYVPAPDAVFAAAMFWFPEKVAALETAETEHSFEIERSSYPLPEKLRRAFEEIACHAVPRLRNLLHQGKLKAYYFTDEGCRSIPEAFWATTQADGVIESGTYWPFGTPIHWYDQVRKHPIFVKQSELDELLVNEPTENRSFPMGGKPDLAAAYRRPEIARLARRDQREAIKQLEQFKPYHITDRLFREAERANGKRTPGVKRRQDN